MFWNSLGTSTRMCVTMPRMPGIACKMLKKISHVSDSNCRNDEYRCNNGFCIHERYKCDGQRQCPTGEDEQQCSSSKIVILLNTHFERLMQRKTSCHQITSKFFSDVVQQCRFDEFACDGRCIQVITI